MALSVADIQRLRRPSPDLTPRRRFVIPQGPEVVMPSLDALRNAPRLGGLGGFETLYTPEEAELMVPDPIATPEEEQEILRRFEQREMGPKGSPTNPPIGDVPGDLDEGFRTYWMNFLLGGLRSGYSGA